MSLIEKPTDGPELIYLEPGNPPERCWCEDDSPGLDDGPWIEYVRHDVVAAKDAELTRLSARVAELEGMVDRAIIGLFDSNASDAAYDLQHDLQKLRAAAALKDTTNE